MYGVVSGLETSTPFCARPRLELLHQEAGARSRDLQDAGEGIEPFLRVSRASTSPGRRWAAADSPFTGFRHCLAMDVSSPPSVDSRSLADYWRDYYFSTAAMARP